jgi:hypothetical protein
MSYLVIENMKLVVEIEDIEDIEPFERKILDEIISGKDTDDYDIDLDDVEITDLTFKEAVVLYKAHDMVKSLLGIDIDKMLLFWLKNRDVEYVIESDIDLSKFQRDGYVVLEKDL